MQRLTYELIGARPPITQLDSEKVRIRMSNLGFINPSIILKTDNTVKVIRTKNIYTISSNLTIKQEQTNVSDNGIITLSQLNYGVQEVLINVETSSDPAYAEVIDYSVNGNNITFDTSEYNGKEAYIKYLTIKN